MRLPFYQRRVSFGQNFQCWSIENYRSLRQFPMLYILLLACLLLQVFQLILHCLLWSRLKVQKTDRIVWQPRTANWQFCFSLYHFEEHLQNTCMYHLWDSRHDNSRHLDPNRRVADDLLIWTEVEQRTDNPEALDCSQDRWHSMEPGPQELHPMFQLWKNVFNHYILMTAWEVYVKF